MKFVRLGTLVFSFLAALTRAQQPWSAALSPTTQTLHGIAHSGGTAVGGTAIPDPVFVAVGDRGTVVTSPDGTAWTARTSGTDATLRGIAWAPSMGVFIAVGDGGTILTSPDGITWTPRASGTTQRLNAVAWTRKRFTYPDVVMAVGANGTALTSSDLAGWTPRTTGVNVALNSVTSAPSGAFPEYFAIVGDDGTILTTHDEGTTFQPRASGTTRDFATVAYFSANSSNGYLATGEDFVLTRGNEIGTEWSLNRGANADGGETGIVYHGAVSFNGALVAVGDQGRMRDEFGRAWQTNAPFTASWRAVAANNNRVVAVGTGGAIASAPFDPTIHREVVISTSFLADSIVLHAELQRPGSNSLYALQWSVDDQPIDGANGATLRLNSRTARNATYKVAGMVNRGAINLPAGAFPMATAASVAVAPVPTPPAIRVLDPNFRAALSSPPRFIVALPDDRILIATESEELLRLGADGARDATFNATGALPAGRIEALARQADGRILVLVNNTGTGRVLVCLLPNGTRDATFQPDRMLTLNGTLPLLLDDGRWLAVVSDQSAVLRRFLPNGSVDSSYAPVDLGASLTSLGGTTSATQVVSARDTQGRIYLGTRHNDISFSLAYSSGRTRLRRLTREGLIEESFTPVELAAVHFLAATEAGLVVRTRTSSWGRNGPVNDASEIFRLHFDGSRDETFKSIRASWSSGNISAGPEGLSDVFDLIDVAADGSIMVRSTGRLGRFGVVRFTTDGELDRDFAAELGLDALQMTSLTPLPNGDLLVGGPFTNLATGAGPLVRLRPERHAAVTHLRNASVRARVGSGAKTLIAGFTTANGPTSVLARGAGPALRAFDVPDALADPQIALFAGAIRIAGNDDWGSAGANEISAATTRVGAFPFAAGSADAALVATGIAGGYSLQVSGKNSADGVALAEIYHAGTPPQDARSPRLTNLSVRSVAGTGGDAFIVGFIIGGEAPRNVLIRAVGPGLEKFGLPAPLFDPTVTLYRGGTVVAANDDWAIDTEVRTTLLEAFTAVGAFPLDYQRQPPYATSKDAAMLLTLAPGNYTVHVSGKGGASGVALAEIYELP